MVRVGATAMRARWGNSACPASAGLPIAYRGREVGVGLPTDERIGKLARKKKCRIKKMKILQNQQSSKD